MPAPANSSVIKGISSVSYDPEHPTDAPGQASEAVIGPSEKRLLADRARALIAETCGDMAEAAKLIGCGTRVRRDLTDVAVEHHSDGLRLHHRAADVRVGVGLPDLFVQDPGEASGRDRNGHRPPPGRTAAPSCC